MANPTTNFGWVMPTSTDLVTDLPADFEVFGQGVDTSLVDLKGGTTGQVLSKTSGTDMDFTWTTLAAGGGKVLQVVQGTYSTATTSSSTTYADTGLTATITPTLSSSKVLVLMNQAGCGKSAGNDGTGLNIKLLRGATLLAGQYDQCFDNATGTYVRIGTVALLYLDTPATTSATTYKTQFMNSSGASGTVAVQISSSVSSIILLEIGA